MKSHQSALTIILLSCVLTTTAFSATASSTEASTNIWRDVPPGPPDAILGIAQAFRECTAENKVNVCVGAYRDEKGQPWVLPSVRSAEEIMLSSENKEYLPIEGDSAFVNKALRFAYGANAPLDRIAGVQTLSGTGACRIGGEFLSQFYSSKNILVPDPTWGNHHKIFKECGLTVGTYRYYDRSTNRLDLQGMLEDLRNAPDGSTILLHACAHNPTGCDPTDEQWDQLLDVIRQKQHLIFFDSAYQGFASGDAEADAKALRRVMDAGYPMLLAQSFAKNFGLYGERCGTLSVVCHDAAQKDILMSQLKCIVRPMYSSPPKHGSSIVRTVLSDEKLTQQYYQECASMADRIQTMRQRLVQALQDAGSSHDWSHISEQIGMFAFTGMSAEMCDTLTDQYNIFLTRDGRISIAGLNDDNLGYVAKAIHSVTDGKSITSN
ncbi:aspartate aminotransferase [Nitzschia inconspicua]|uniref:aspartate transaminase n=1 Tax=Nitzschia inconspicua TaxID=303405 RepID=A0A9K3LNN3_9STRA|nr:aspartate aminotransferase [Nitzschia inconspicua]